MAPSNLGGSARILGVGQQGPGQTAVQILGQHLAGFGPQAPAQQGPRAGGPSTTATGVVADLMLDRRASQMFLQAIDGWLRGGALSPFQAPLPLPPQQAQQLQQRLAALAQQSSPYWAVPDAQTATTPPHLPGSAAVTQTPSRDRLAKQLLDRSTQARVLQGFGKAQGTFQPPKAVQTACRRGLDLAPEHGGDGLTDAALGRARQMAAGKPVSLDTLKRIKAFHSRHTYEKQSDPPSPGYVAQQLWGGQAGQTWAGAHADDDGDGDQAQKAGAPKWKKKGWVGPGGAWATAKRRAEEQGKGDDYAAGVYRKMVGKSRSASALAVLQAHLVKSGGPGSRGGRVIGTTRSGKAIYSAGHEKYGAVHQAVSEAGSTHEEDAAAAHHTHQAHKGWTRHDHLDAAEAHQAHAGTLHRSDPERAQSHTAAQGHANVSRHIDNLKSPTEEEHRATLGKSTVALLQRVTARSAAVGRRR